MNNDNQIKRAFEEPVEKAKRLIGLKHSAYKDYVAARILFLNEQLHQAAIFANTCVEKELKACLYSLGVDCKIQHNTFKIFNLLRNHDSETFNKLNAEFIKVLSKIYESRYHESLSPGYNFVIIKRKFLAELDYTYSVLERKVRFKIKRFAGEPPKTNYEIDVLNKFPIVTKDNYLFEKSKEQYLGSSDVVFEFRMLFNHEVAEALYVIPKNDNFQKFDYEGLASTSDNNQSFKISNHQEGINHINLYRNGVLQSMKIE
jgi:HEPN domain-containing protein